MSPPQTTPTGPETGWDRAAAGLGWWRLRELPPESIEVNPDPVQEPVVIDAPGPAFDSALLAAALGMARRPVAGRETVALARRVARRPHLAVGPVAGLVAETGRIAAGRSSVTPWKTDRRYSDQAWRGNPLFRRMSQFHAAAGDALESLVDDASLDPDADYRLRIAVSNLVAALSPANFPLLNPAALKAIIDTGGANLVTGARRFYKDVRTPPRLPARSDPEDFELGVDVAATPGEVVLRTEMMELIQYGTVSAEVRTEPLLVVPSVVNKFYLTDLAPGRSLVEFAISKGQQTFSISWRNPGPDQRDAGLDAYISAIIEALDTVHAITGAERAHTLGVCAGGQLLTIALAHLAAIGQQDRVASVSLPVCVLHHAEAGSLTGLLTRETADLAAAAVARAGVVRGAALQGALAWLRPIDSIWWAWVQRYLVAADMPKMDLFYWSEDITNLPARLVTDLLELALENSLAKPGALTVLSKPVDLGVVEVDAYLIAGLTDHLTHWQSCYRTASLLGSNCEFILVSGGHLQAILRPPGGRAAGYRTADRIADHPEAWLATAVEHDGSWWDHWLGWLEARSSGTRTSPRRLGNRAHPPIEPAPGSYVRTRAVHL
ncbi:MAG TPA: alpha/beta fold hydrolase [Solirubrobacteraceae bacterium]|nr:alpha/beta fold hydrolase [Solirubrobacteraceae bacterium]